MAVMARDPAGRVTGIAVFAVGVLLLLAVFYLAYVELVASGALTVPGRSAGEAALFVAAKGLFLFVLGFVASAIANKGIALYQAAGGHGGEGGAYGT
jgi:Na+-transporting NADH:ubiquinone oxidoreductase subunit NqrF